MTLDELIRGYLDHADQYYRRGDGTPTRHAKNLEIALRPLRSDLRADRFNLASFRMYRDKLLERGLQRSTVNQWCGWVRGCFRWAAQRELIPAEVAHQLKLMEPLRFGRTSCRERTISKLVGREVVHHLARICPQPVASMVMVQWLCGMRPGEVCAMRFDQLQKIEGWTVYIPEHHKTQHYGKTRTIVIPLCAREFMPKDGEGYVFMKPRRPAGPYTTNTYAQVMRRACKKQGIDVVTPGQLRRSAATIARRVAGKEAAQRLLGHTSGDMTEHYYDLELIDAIESMEQLVTAGWGRESAEVLASRG
ncbi:tyrosine-type recombinase/integrase [Mucisphaera calidilacus]|uniref:Site-specific tyrosine recombinase XerC n=1 Tax=Mucisphaera calidilacus TaxID=2527982 RepID=A0A518BU00_9BACT|nr:tyrosine-type recombinase/integrase [Mucisphaera calidilacus]QDU70437.1 site-specific tyrosine recombinase XerC [Mucisphaera calidilacus]